MGIAFYQSLVEEYERNSRALIEAYQQLSVMNQSATKKNEEAKTKPKSRKGLKKISSSLLSDMNNLFKLTDHSLKMKQDPLLKLKFENHIRFMNVLLGVTQNLLQSEAMEEFIKKEKEREAFLKFHVLDREKDEAKQALYTHFHHLALHEHEAILIAMLVDRIMVSELIISELEKTKQTLVESLQENEAQFDEEIKKIIKKSPIFENLSDTHQKDLTKRIKELCNEFDLQFPPPIPVVQPITQKDSSSTQKQTSKKEETHPKDKTEMLESIQLDPRLQEKFMAVRAFLDQHNLQLNKDVKIENYDKKMNSMAKKLVKRHEQNRKKKDEISGEINEIDKKIQKEEDKKNECLKRLNTISNPKKREQIETQIKKTYDRFEQKYHKKKSELKEKVDEILKEDQELIQSHQDVFKEKISHDEAVLKQSEKRFEEGRQYQKSMEGKPRFHPLAVYKRAESRRELIQKEKEMIQDLEKKSEENIEPSSPAARTQIEPSSPAARTQIEPSSPAARTKTAASLEQTTFTPSKQKYCAKEEKMTSSETDPLKKPTSQSKPPKTST